MTHRLLKRQLKKQKLKESAPPTLEQWQEFIGQVEMAYTTADRDRQIMEQSMAISSREMKELYEQNRQRADIQSELQTSALQASANGIVITDTEGSIIWANEAVSALTGYDLDELIGRNPSILKSGVQEDTYYQNMWQTIAAGTVWHGEVINRRKDGSLYTEEMTITPVKTAAGEITHYIAVKQDISERKQKEAKIEKNQQSQTVLNDLLRLSLQEAPLETLLQQALDIIISPSWLSVQAKGSIFLVDPDAPALVMAAQRDLARPLLTKCARVPFGHCLCGQAAAAGETLFFDCVDHRHEITYEGMHAHGHFNVPILLDDEVVGVINLYVEDGHQRDEQEVAFLEAVANTLASLIKRKRAEDSLEEQYTFLKQVVDLSPALIFAKDRDGRFILANQDMADVYGVSIEDLIGKTDADFVDDPEKAQQFLQEDREIMDSLQEKQTPMDITVDVGGHTHHFLTTKRPIIGPDGKSRQILGVVTDVTRLSQVEKALRQSEEQTRRIIDTALDAVISINEKGIIVGWNLRAESMFGWLRAEAINKSLYETIIPARYSDAYSNGMQHYLATGEHKVLNKRIEITAVHRDGHEFPIELSISPSETDDGYIFNAFLRDITERVQLGRQIQESLELRSRQLEISRALAAARTEPEVIQAVLQQAAYFPQAAMSIFTSQEDSGNEMAVLRAYNPFESGLQPIPAGLSIPASQMPLLFAPDTDFATDDIHNDERATPMMLRIAGNAGFVSWATFPITAGGEWFGTLMAASAEEAFFDEYKRALYNSLAEQSAVALRAARLFDETEKSLEQRSHQIRLSTQVAQAIATASDLSHLYKQVVTLIKETFGYYHTQLLRYDPALDVMALVVGYGEVGEQMLAMNHSLPMGVGLIGTAASLGRAVLRANTANDPHWQPNALLPDTKGEIAVPIKLGDEILGVLDVQSDTPDALTEDDQLLLEGLCGQIAIAIESTRLQQEMEERLRELTTLQRYMSREGWQKYRADKMHTTGFWFDQTGVRPLESNEFRQLTPILTESGNGNGHTAVQDDGKNTTPDREIKDIPLVVRGEAIGAFGVEDDSERPFTPEETEFLNAIAEQVSEALEAARLFEQTQDALTGQEQLASELSTVAEVSTAASTILEVNQLLQTVVELVKARFDLYHAHIYLVDEARNTLVLRAGAGDVGQIMVLEGREIAYNAESLVARAARTQEGFIENDVRKIIDFLPHPLLPETRSEMAIPLIVGGQLIGVLDLQSDKTDFFTEEAMQVQRTLASQIAVAVQNASMYADQVETASKLRQVDKLKSEFLASMSHELRTPLNSIIGFADVLLEGLDGDLNERMEQDVRLIRDSGAHLRDLIGDILDMSKIEAGRMELRYEEIDMHQLAHDILATARSLAKEKNLELNLNLDENVTTITADRTRMRQVLWNIMGNAIKFTEKGSVTLSMKAERDMLRISIRDTGIGIKPEDMAAVFEQFRQIDGSLNRSVGGTGLGMPITKKLIELHGGEIGVDSVMGQGSTFWFTVPIQRLQPRREKLDTGTLPPLG